MPGQRALSDLNSIERFSVVFGIIWIVLVGLIGLMLISDTGNISAGGITYFLWMLIGVPLTVFVYSRFYTMHASDDRWMLWSIPNLAFMAALFASFFLYAGVNVFAYIFAGTFVFFMLFLLIVSAGTWIYKGKDK